MPQSHYAIHVPPTDLSVALDCEADRAEKERFPNVAKRQRELALHIRNASHHATQHCPEGFRVQFTLQVEYVLNVNPSLKDECR